MAGLRFDGMVAPMVLNSPINGAWFEVYVCQVLAPVLHPGDIVVMDSFPSDKRASVSAMIETRGAGSPSFRHTAPTSTPSRRPSQS